MAGERTVTHLVFAALARAPDDPALVARRILENGSYQRSLPKEFASLAPHPLFLGSLEPLLWLLLVTALLVAAALAAAWLHRRLSLRARDAQVNGEAALPPLLVPVAGAEALARDGRFAEAIHSLLLETLAALSRAAKLTPSLTSREVLEKTQLPPRARDALFGLVRAVEVSRFGGREAGLEDYRASLERFEAFLDTYRPSGKTPGASL